MRSLLLITILTVLCHVPSTAQARSMEEERALCLTRSALARAQCKDPHERSVKYYIDENECGIIEYFPASCTKRSVIKCCFPKSEKELKADKEA
ncbi:hypothetical protein ADUPG1_002501, partial [Aduncisulcus paluster]